LIKEENVMKKTMRKIIALITMCLILAFPLTAYAAPGGLHKQRRTYEQAVEHFEEIKNKQVHIRFSHRGLYVANESILYARQIVGVNEDGTYQIGPWECISHRYNVCYCEDKQITLPGEYVAFAYSYDVSLGTDWPFSRPFWNNTVSPAKNIQIVITGAVRTPEIRIAVNGTTVYFHDNLPAHY
jgi:hypothetical protein